MKTTKAAVQNLINRKYPHLKSWPLDHAIVEIRRIIRNEQEYALAVNQGNDYEEAY